MLWKTAPARPGPWRRRLSLAGTAILAIFATILALAFWFGVIYVGLSDVPSIDIPPERP